MSEKDTRVTVRMDSQLKQDAQIRALQLGYGIGERSGVGIGLYILDLIKKDLKENILEKKGKESK
jgi:hypothetical protein